MSNKKSKYDYGEFSKDEALDPSAPETDPLTVLADLKKRFSVRHSFSDADIASVKADLEFLESLFK